MSLSSTVFNILSVKNPKQLYLITKAKRAYATTHPECAICGNPNNIEIHHVIPVHIDITMSCNFKNFVSACDSNNNGCHRWLCHFGDFKNKWNLNIRQYAIASRLFLVKTQPNRKFIISTNDLIKEYSQALKMTQKQFLESVRLFNK